MTDFRERFGKLTANDLRRLYNTARQFTRKSGPAVANLDSDEILSETWVRFADSDGRALHPEDDLVSTFIGGMKSVAFNMAKKSHVSDFELNERFDFPSHYQSPEDCAIDSEIDSKMLQIVGQIFDDDKEAQSVFLMSLKGYSRTEIEISLGISPLEREAARRRSERRLKKYRRNLCQRAEGLRLVAISDL